MVEEIEGESLLNDAAAIGAFKQRYDDWYKPQANRYASHFFLLNNSRVFRELRGEDLRWTLVTAVYNDTLFLTPESADIEFIDIRRDQVAQGIEISEEALLA